MGLADRIKELFSSPDPLGGVSTDGPNKAMGAIQRSVPVGMTQELGSTGLKQMGGVVIEEWLPQLQGERGIKVWREMSENDPTVGAVLFAIEMLIRQVDWSVEPASEDPQDVANAEFLESCMHDMDRPWVSFISDVLTMLAYGWSVHEIVYKLRRGASGDQPSDHDDGRIGWARLPIRGQDTLLQWVFDDHERVEAFIQVHPTTFQRIKIPIGKLIHFRTRERRGPEGMALDPLTPIPTPDGWKVVDDLKVGDKVFGDDGRVRYVTGRADWDDRPCYRVNFLGGDSIIADENHLWYTVEANARHSGSSDGSVKSTRDIKESVRARNSSNHSVPLAGCLDYSEQNLLVDPYVLGLWLGDGTKRNGNISCHADDLAATVSEIESSGYLAKSCHSGPPGSLGRCIRVQGPEKWSSLNLATQLRQLGLICNKHVPEHYLRGSASQRIALLQGLMDSDGTVDAYGRCEFTNTNMNLVDGVAELARSLGCQVSTGIRKHPRRGRLSAYCAKFTPVSFCPFRLPRKIERTKDTKAREWHYIASVEPVARRRTVCIEVDSPSHLYLAGLSMIPTHNSILRNAFRPWLFKKRLEEIEAIGIERDMAGLPVAHVPAEFLSSSATPDQVAMVTAIKRLVRGIKVNEQMGVVFPMDHDHAGNNRYRLELLSSSGGSKRPVDPAIRRYKQDIATTVLADFVLLGHDKVGSFALSSSKTEVFGAAMGAYLDTMANVFNSQAVPRLFTANGISGPYPKIVHGDIETPDLDSISNFVLRLSNAGAITPDDKLERHLRRAASLPEREM